MKYKVTFINPRLQAEFFEDGFNARLSLPLDYNLDQDGVTRMMFVPAGFRTDWTSIPRVFWRILPPWGRYSRAAVIHDWYYREQPKGFSRKDSDQIFKSAMKYLGVSMFTRNTIYTAVRIGGWRAWRKNAMAKRAK